MIRSAMFALLGVGCLASGAAARPFTAHDLATMERVSDPHLAPDGARVVYNVRTTDYDAAKTQNQVWIADMRPGAMVRLLQANATSPAWAADGEGVYFLSGRSGSMQVWRAPLIGSAVQVTDLPLDVGAFRVSPDGQRLILALAVFPDCPTLACTKERLDAEGARKSKGVVYERLFVRHWDSWADGTRNALYAMALNSPRAEPTRLMAGFDGDAPSKPFGDDEEFNLTPDGKHVLFAARVAGKTEAWSTNFDIYLVPVDGSAPPRNLTPDNPAWDALGAVSPDGRTLAYRAMARPGFEADRFAVRLMDLATGASRELAPSFDRSVDKLAWAADGKSLVALAEDLGQKRLFRIDAASGKIDALTGNGAVAGFDTARGAIAFARAAADSPAQIYALREGREAALTKHNGELFKDVAWGAPKQFEFKGWNGETVRGMVIKPSGWQAGKKYPVAFLIHGGPQTSFGNIFHYRWNYQALAGMGYAVVAIDYHGSTGYGQAFTDSISRHWGDRPLEDLQKGWAAALAKYPFLDATRACALGGSYGGYMVNWIASQWKQPWKCLVNHDGVFDQRMMGASTEELWFDEWENGGSAFSTPELYDRFNPILHVKDWEKPMLVIHGQNDFRVPLEQGLATFNALQRRGIESKFLYFPNENHWVLNVRNVEQWYGTVGDWLKAHAEPGGK
jgi:acylaminoacyl-peptidase